MPGCARIVAGGYPMHVILRETGRAAVFVCRRQAAPRMRARAPPERARLTASDARQPQWSVLTTHPAPAIVLSRANLDAQPLRR
jgi:hypothetical protein